MSKFDEDFSKPMYSSDGAKALTGKISKDEAYQIFKICLDEDICIDDIISGRVKFGFGELNGEIESFWWLGRGGIGSQPVWYIE